MPPKKTGPAADTGARITPRGPPLRAILPVHRVAVAALQALHFLGLPGDVLALVATGAHEMRLVHHAPALGDVLAELDVVLGNAHLHAVHVEHHPGLPRVLDDAVPRTAPQPLLLGPVAAAASPPDFGHHPSPSLQVLGLARAFAHQHEDRRLRHHQVRLVLERNLHRRLAKEQRVVAELRLHRQVFHVGAADLPRLVVHARRLGHRRARARGDDAATLYLATLERRRPAGEADVGPLLALLRRAEHAVPHDDQALGRLVRHGDQYTTSRAPGEAAPAVPET